MPNRQKFIGNAEALIELLNDMLNDAFSDEISEENKSDFDVKNDLNYALDCFCDIFNIDIDKSLITDRDNGDNPIDTPEKAEKAMTENESEPEKLTGDMFEAEGPDGTRHIFKASSLSAGTIIDPPGCNTFYHVHRPHNPNEPFCVWVDPWDNYYTNDDLAEIVRRCNAAHSPDTTMIISRARDIANN